jgi:hypothetical protein
VTIKIPTAADQATTEWFTEVFRQTGRLDPDNQVKELTSKRVGNGLVGESVRFEFGYDGPADRAPTSVVCKFPAAIPEYRAAGISEMLYGREVRFYQDIAPTVDVRAPEAIYTDFDETSHDFVLVLEDLSPATGGDHAAGCSIPQAEVVVDAAAALHGPAWGKADLETASWNVRPVWIPRIESAYPGLFAQFKEAFADRNTPEELAIGEILAPNIGAWFAHQPRPWTVTHGDFRLDNMLFDIRNGQEPVGILDWQTLLPAPGTVDVAYFIGGCLPTDLRRDHEDTLLHRYHDGLLHHGVKDYDFDQCKLDYRYHAFMGYFMCSYAAMLVPRTERGDNMFSIWLTRVAEHIKDHDSLALLPR